MKLYIFESMGSHHIRSASDKDSMTTSMNLQFQTKKVEYVIRRCNHLAFLGWLSTTKTRSVFVCFSCCFLHNPRVAGSPACQGPHYGEVQLPARRIDTTPWRRSIEKINLKWRSTSLIEFQRRKIRLSDFFGWCWFWNWLNIILVTIIYTPFLSLPCIEIAFQRIK